MPVLGSSGFRGLGFSGVFEAFMVVPGISSRMREGGSVAARKSGRLVAMTRADRYTLATSSTATAQHRGPALGLHAGAKAVRLGAAMPVGLECALWHGNALLFLK